MSRATADFDLTLDDLRAVAQFAAQGAQAGSTTPLRGSSARRSSTRAAIEAACVFIEGANRTNLQRVAATRANRAAP